MTQKPPRPVSTVPAAQITFFVDIPVMNIYGNLSIFPKTITVKEAITQLSVHLNEKEKKAISRYHIFSNGLRLMDENRQLSTYIKSSSSFCFQRDDEYEFSCADSSSVFISDVSTLEAAKTLAMQAFPSLKNFNLYEFHLFKGETQLEPASKILCAKLLEGDSLQLRIKVKQNPNQAIPQTIFLVTSSPFSERAKQKRAFAKQGLFKKQGFSNKSWKERFFVLDGDKLQYFDPKKKHKAALGTIYLDEVTGVDIQETMTGNGNWFFEIKVPGRNLLCFTRDEQMMREWINAINALVILARQELAALTESEIVHNFKARDLDRIRGSIDRSGSVGLISGPVNVKHINHITTNWEWAGDVSVFQLDEVLGKGASGTVLKAFVRDCNFTVAIKIVSQTNKRVQEELKKEIDVLKKCKNPNIVAYYGTYLQQAEVWIIMDYCGAGSLKDLLRLSQDTLNERQTKHVFGGTVKGLLHLHKQGILHMDIKSANILVTEEGDVKLADFGVSTQLSTHTTFASATEYIGSPLFMSPEVVRKDKYNSASDIWSLGITVIEMVDGVPPNMDITCVEMLPLIDQRPPPTLKNPKQHSADLNGVISCCLQKDANLRYSCLDLLTHPFLDPASLPKGDCLASLISIVRSITLSKK